MPAPQHQATLTTRQAETLKVDRDADFFPSRPSRRVGLPDLSELGNWLVGRLKAKYPEKHEVQLMSWLRASCVSNEVLFVRGDRSAAMAVIGHRLHEQRPVIEEVFVLAMDPKSAKDVAEATGLYGDIGRWALNLGAREIEVENLSDLNRDQIKAAFGAQLFIRQQPYIKLGF